MSEDQPKKNKGGRPSLYRSEYCQQLLDFFDVDYTMINAEDKIEGVNFPSLVRFARSIGVTRSTLYEWASKHKEFSDTLSHCKEIQEDIILNNSFKGYYNAPFAQFILKNNHGFKDKQEIEKKTEEKRIVEVRRAVDEEGN